MAAFKFLSSKVISFLLCKVLVCTVDRKKTNNSGIFPTLRCYSLDYRSYYMCYNCQEEMVFGKITDITTHKSAISYQKILQKYVKAKLDIGFLKKCKWTDVYPKFVRWKHVKNKTKNERNKLYKAKVNDGIKARHNDFRKLQQQHVDSQNQLRQSTTWLKYHSILFSINRLQSKKTHLIELRHQKKHDNLIIEKRLCDCTQRNPNKIITNLTNITLTQDEISVLELG